MTWVQTPFALFPLVEVSHKVIEFILKESGRASVAYPLSLATKKYEDGPQRKDQNFDGDKPPISSDYKSPFIGNSIHDAADWMRSKPKNVNVDAHHFVLLDKRTEQDGTIIVCRIGGTLLDDMADLDWMRKSAFDGGLMLMGMNAYHWEEEPGERKPKIEY